MKLDTANMKTAEDILTWARAVAEWEFDHDTATAERLAYCVKVTKIVERDNSVAVGEFISNWTAKRILKEAAQKEGK